MSPGFASSNRRRMKRALLFALACFAACNLSLAVEEEEDQEKSTANPDAGGIMLEPASGKIAEGDEITITFPRSMVPDSVIDDCGFG